MSIEEMWEEIDERRKEVARLKTALKECGQVLDDCSTAGIVYSPLVERIKQALAKAKEALK